MADKQAVKSANRVLDLFELLGQWSRELSHTEIATTLKIPKSSLSQLLPNLVDRGYVQFIAETKGYRLGAKLAELAGQQAEQKDVIGLARPVLHTIATETGESAALNVLQGDSSKVVATVNSQQRLLSHMRNGDLAPLYATSGGKAIIAFLPDDMLNSYLKRVKLEEITKNTIRSIEELTLQLESIRRARVAYAFEEFTPGICGIAVPILSQSGSPLGSLNVAMPAVRYNTRVRDRALQVLRQAVDAMNQKLGFIEPVRSKKTRRRG
ncbi:MAG TPA: IclR family transcriptional regulator [Pseudolabrys sp.]|jgi:DNA-binding IclR family transcriptional regulator|nr:IclR family transcriptional regulator [Pseudolabrys sp.]